MLVRSGERQRYVPLPVEKPSVTPIVSGLYPSHSADQRAAGRHPRSPGPGRRATLSPLRAMKDGCSSTIC